MDSLDSFRERFDALEQRTHTVERQLRWWRGLACSLVVLPLLSWALPFGVAQEESPAASSRSLAERLAALEHKLRYLTMAANKDGLPEVLFTGVNVRIVNGLGSTDCTDEQGEPIPNCPNGLGNLIVGYNEPRAKPDEGEYLNVRTGSHNVVVGKEHNFSRFGGIVVGLSNEISGDFTSVSGGQNNKAASFAASVSGGRENLAGIQADVSEGGASVSGGIGNRALGFYSSISGGQDNETGDFAASVSGGGKNVASGVASSITGGGGNEAFGFASSISGGLGNKANGDNSSVSGGENNEARANLSSVGGGENNVADGIESSISGGKGITLDTEHGWAAGSIGDEVTGSFRSE